MRTDHNALTFRRGDAVAIACVVLAALAMLACFLFFSVSGEASVARVYQDGELIREIRLDTNGEFTVEGAWRNVITVRDGKIAVTESNCPGGDCVHSGWIQSPGRSIVCLPNRVEIRLEGTLQDDDVDAVIR